MTSLLELAERCEKATGPDREIDLAISVAVDFKGVFGDLTVIYQWGPGGDEIACHYPPENGKARQGYLDPVQFVPRWSASLDAAMTLVLEGWHLCLTHEPTKDFGFQWFAQFRETAEAPAMAATPALALTAACLRARADSLTQGESHG